MKIRKGILLPFLCVLAAVLFIACNNTEGETDPAADGTSVSETTTKETTTEESTTEESTTREDTTKAEEKKTLESLGIDCDALSSANEIDLLYNKYGTITIYKNYGVEDEERLQQIFKYDDEYVFIDCWSNADGETKTEGWIKGLYFYSEDDGFKASSNISEMNGKAKFPYNSHFSSEISDRDFVYVDEGDDYYRLRRVYEDMEEREKYYYYFDKESLAIKRIVKEDGLGFNYEAEIKYGEKLKDCSKALTRSFKKNTKKVTVIGEIVSGDKVSEFKTVMKLPHNWDFTPEDHEPLGVYMKEGFMDDYIYPGHGKNYTLYVTNSLG